MPSSWCKGGRAYMPRRRPDKRGGLEQEGTLHPHQGRVRAALFWEHPTFFDTRDELQVKYEMLRAHFVDEQPVANVCTAFGYSRQTFYVLRDRYVRRGIAGLRDGRPGPVAPTKCTPEVVAFLRAQRADDPRLPTMTLMERLAREQGVHLHRRTVERLVQPLPRKKTSRARERESASPGPDRLWDPGSFCTAGGDPQVQYERHRLAFLAWATDVDERSP